MISGSDVSQEAQRRALLEPLSEDELDALIEVLSEHYEADRLGEVIEKEGERFIDWLTCFLTPPALRDEIDRARARLAEDDRAQVVVG